MRRQSRCYPRLTALLLFGEKCTYPVQSGSDVHFQRRRDWNHSHSDASKGRATEQHRVCECVKQGPSVSIPLSLSPAHCPHHPHLSPVETKASFQGLLKTI